jgi:hypothetical protein
MAQRCRYYGDIYIYKRQEARQKLAREGKIKCVGLRQFRRCMRA